MSIKASVQKLVRKFGVDLVRYSPGVDHGLPPDLSNEDKKIITAVHPYTMTSVERVSALLESVNYITTKKVPGAIVECGVWRGGSSMAALMKLKALGSLEREIYLYDTFEGMSEPTANDKSLDGVSAEKQLAETEQGTGVWCKATLEDVQANVGSTGYPASKVHYIRGKVEDTIPKTLPGSIALLRLDTDWYESTRHELEHLFPLLNPRGVLIVDDYGHWAGARKAVDEYFLRQNGDYFFHRIDYTGRTITRIGP